GAHPRQMMTETAAAQMAVEFQFVVAEIDDAARRNRNEAVRLVRQATQESQVVHAERHHDVIASEVCMLDVAECHLMACEAKFPGQWFDPTLAFAEKDPQGLAAREIAICDLAGKETLAHDLRAHGSKPV